MQILRGIAGKYRNLFDGGAEGNEHDNTGTFNQKWGWIATINAMSNNDRSKWDYYFDLNVIEFLNSVTFYKDKADEDYRVSEQNRRHGS